jgi:hypothetical protein
MQATPGRWPSCRLQAVALSAKHKHGQEPLPATRADVPQEGCTQGGGSD